MQLVRRLGESGTVDLLVHEAGSSVDSPRQLQLSQWLQGEAEPDPIKALGISPWRPQVEPVLAELDPEGPASAAGLKVGDRVRVGVRETVDGLLVEKLDKTGGEK